MKGAIATQVRLPCLLRRPTEAKCHAAWVHFFAWGMLQCAAMTRCGEIWPQHTSWAMRHEGDMVGHSGSPNVNVARRPACSSNHCACTWPIFVHPAPAPSHISLSLALRSSSATPCNPHLTIATLITLALALSLDHAQVGLVQFNNFVLADNGGGPKAHIVNGKENGAAMELTWVLDDRNHTLPTVVLDDMAGVTRGTARHVAVFWDGVRGSWCC